MIKRTRLKDVAERAGVAVNTASMILNRRSNSWASKATEERVHQAAKELNYQPSRAAVALRLGKFNTIGLLVPDLQNPYFSRIAEMLEDEVAAKGYDLVIESTRLDPIREGKCLESIFERQVDGVICFLLDNERHRDFLADKFAQGKAIVAFGEADHKELPVDIISGNYIPGISQAIMMLANLGHKRFAYLLAVAEGQAGGDRPDTFCKMMQKAGIPPENLLVVTTDSSISGARAAAREVLAGSADRPTAILAHNDLAALGVIRAAADLGLRVPADLSVVGVDNTLIGEHLPSALTTVGLPDALMVREATSLILKRLDNPTYAPLQKREFSSKLILRESTGLVPKPSWQTP